MAHDRELAGIRCSEILERLSDVLEGSLEPDVARRVQAHLEGCAWCAQFGAEFSAVVGALQSELAGPAEVDGDATAQLVALLMEA